MINLNGVICNDTALSFTNRSFLYGDALFDTLLFQNDSLYFLKEHYDRLIYGMSLLRMNVPKHFTLEYWEKEIRKTIQTNRLKKARVRTNIFRKSGGFFTPETKEVQFLIQTQPSNYRTKQNYTLGLYESNYLNTNTIDNIKTTNRLQNVLAGLYAKENGYDNCILLNHNKRIAEVVNGNIFLAFGKEIVTPALTEGCIDGIIRKKVLEKIHKLTGYQAIEMKITPDKIEKADEMFLTNSIMGIQPVSRYGTKIFDKKIAEMLMPIF